MPLINMGDVEEFEPMPKNIYPFTLEEYEWVDAESDDKYGYAKLTFKYDGEEEEYQNRKAFRNLSASPKSLIYMKRALIALGAEEEDVSSEFDPDEIFPDLIGNPCQLRLEVKEYEGTQQNEVRAFMPLVE